jgi:hypothetical protein
LALPRSVAAVRGESRDCDRAGEQQRRGDALPLASWTLIVLANLVIG